MKIHYVNAEYEGEIKLSQEILDYLENNKIKSIALFASVQFLNLENVKNQLKSFEINTTITKRAEKEIQTLGCNIYPDSFKDTINKSDLILYIGDGLFHPKAILLSQIYSEKIKPVLVFNPISNSMKLLEKSDIENNIKTIKSNLRKFLNAKKIGILVSTKPGQQHLALANKLKQHLQQKSFIFLDNKFDFTNLENFNFIEAWVNTACPRIATDDATNLPKPVINIRDAFDVLEVLEKLDNKV